jgi:hypothetical protein
MAGYSSLYVIGSLGGFMRADGVNPIEFMILVGDSDRQWLEPHYFDNSISPIGKLQVIIPAGPDHADSLLDACIAFNPRYFKTCSSMTDVELAIKDKSRLDFDLEPQEIPAAWNQLREEARPLFSQMNIWRANLELISNQSITK